MKPVLSKLRSQFVEAEIRQHQESIVRRYICGMRVRPGLARLVRTGPFVLNETGSLQIEIAICRGRDPPAPGIDCPAIYLRNAREARTGAACSHWTLRSE